jgi:MFS family permease
MYFQVAMGLSATRAGAALMPGTLALALSFPVAGFLHEYFSPRQIMSGGMLLLAVGWLALGGFAASLSYLAFILVLLVSRVGLAFATTPMNQAALVSLTGDRLGQAAALLGYTRQLGGVFGVAALAGFVAWRSAQLGAGGTIEIPAYAEAFLIVAATAAASLAAVWRL